MGLAVFAKSLETCQLRAESHVPVSTPGRVVLVVNARLGTLYGLCGLLSPASASEVWPFVISHAVLFIDLLTLTLCCSSSLIIRPWRNKRFHISDC